MGCSPKSDCRSDGNAKTPLYSVSPWGNLTGATLCALDHLVLLRGKEMDGRLILAHHGPLEDRAREVGIPAVCYPFENRGLRQSGVWARVRGILPVLLSRWRYVWRVMRLLRSRPGILHIHSRAGASFHALWAGWLARVPVVVTLHEFPDNRKWAARRDAWMLRKLATRIVTVSNATADAYRPQLRGRSIQVIYNVMTVPPELEQRRRGKPILAMIGRLGPRKGTNEFMAACSLLRQEQADFEAWLVGDWVSEVEEENARAQVKRMGLEDLVIFRGATTDMDWLYRNIDLVVVPSHGETFGRVAMEGMGYGLPVVASDVGGLPELVEEKETGFLVPVGDARVLADRIAALLRDPALRHRMGMAGRKRVKERFSPEVYAGTFSELYRDIGLRTG